MFLAKLAVILGAAALLGSCGVLGGSCTEIGCGDHLGLTIAPRDRPWSEGRYELSLTLDGQTHVCDFAFPNPASASAIVEIACNPAASVHLEPSVLCTEMKRPDGSRSESCAPLPDRAKLRASFSGTPSQVCITLVHDGAAVLDQQQQIRYRRERPNGPGCEPVCQQAELELTWP